MRHRAALAVGLVVLAAVPALLGLVGSAYVTRLAQLALVTIALCLALNLLTGTGGLLALDAAVFYGLGAYAAALLALRLGVPAWGTIPLAALLAGTVALALGVVLVRLASVFFAVATMGLAVSFHTVVLNWNDLTRGPMGLRNIPAPGLFGHDLSGGLGAYYLTAALALLALYVAHRCTHSFWGNALRAVREDEACAEGLGLPARWLKAQAYALHGAIIGAMGALYAHVNQFIGPDNFVLLESALILTGVVVGGLGSLPGAVLGGLVMALLPEALREFGHFRIFMLGALLFAAIVFLPRGLWSEPRALALARRVLPPGPWSGRP